MATPQLVKIPRHTDRVLLEAFVAFAAHVKAPHVSVNAGAAGSYTLAPSDDMPSELETLVSYDGALIEGLNASAPGFGIGLYKGGYPVQGQPKSAIYDDVSINFDAQKCTLSEYERVEFFGLLAKQLGSFNPLRHVKGGVSDEQDQVLAIHNATLERLESLNEELIRGSEKFRKSIEKDYRERSKKLESNFDERTVELNDQVDEKRAALIEREEKLAKRIQEVDDRQNTHVRRELRTEILDEIRNRTTEFKLTKGTNNLRWPIHIVCISLACLLGASAVYYAVESISALTKEPLNNIALAVLVSKQLLLSGAFGASVVFYVRWMNAWFSQHATTEFQLRQFQLDIERASWVVETALEWKDVKGSTIPAELLGPISSNLFGSNDAGSSEVAPADELASALLGTASKVRLNVAGSELELDGKKLGKA